MVKIGYYKDHRPPSPGRPTSNYRASIRNSAERALNSLLTSEGFDEAKVQEIVAALETLAQDAQNNKYLQIVYDKYCSPVKNKVMFYLLCCAIDPNIYFSQLSQLE